jgi:hypothetical protein
MFAGISEPKLTATETILYSGLRQMRKENEKLWSENIELRRSVEALENWKSSILQAEVHNGSN